MENKEMTNYFENQDGSVDADGTLYNKIISMGSLNYMDLIKILPKYPEIDKLLMSIPHIVHTGMYLKLKAEASRYRVKDEKVVLDKIKIGNVNLLFKMNIDEQKRTLYNIYVKPDQRGEIQYD